MLEFADIVRLLPHSAPMVLVDRLSWIDPGRSLHAVKTISGSEPCYQSLPDGLPRHRYAYPVSLLIESFGQSAAILWHCTHADWAPNATADAAGDPGTGPAGNEGRHALVGAGQLLMFAAARDIQVHASAYPGDVVHHQVILEHVVAGTAFAAGETWVGRRRIATVGSIIAVLRPVSSAPAQRTEARPVRPGRW